MVGYTPAKGLLPRICGCHPRIPLADPNRALHMWATPIITNDLQPVFALIGCPTMVPGVKGVLRGGSLASWIPDADKLYLRTTLMRV